MSLKTARNVQKEIQYRNNTLGCCSANVSLAFSQFNCRPRSGHGRALRVTEYFFPSTFMRDTYGSYNSSRFLSVRREKSTSVCSKAARARDRFERKRVARGMKGEGILKSSLLFLESTRLWERDRTIKESRSALT